jgi:hypothetical protein
MTGVGASYPGTAQAERCEASRAPRAGRSAGTRIRVAAKGRGCRPVHPSVRREAPLRPGVQTHTGRLEQPMDLGHLSGGQAVSGRRLWLDEEDLRQATTA